MQQPGRRADPLAGALAAARAEPEFALIVAGVPRIDLDHAVGRGQCDPAQQQRAADQLQREIAVPAQPPGRIPVDREARVLDQPATALAQFPDLFGKAVFGVQALPHTAAHGERADERAVAAGQQGGFAAGGHLRPGFVSAPSIAAPDQCRGGFQIVTVAGDGEFHRRCGPRRRCIDQRQPLPGATERRDDEANVVGGVVRNVR